MILRGFDMDIQIKNCNNITSANITILLNKLNIKFALANLLPFKFRERNPDNIQPEAEGIGQEHDTLCF